MLAWTGALVFAAALFYFLYTYAVTFGETPAPGPAAPAIARDVALFSVFALHHSVFARERVRAVIARLAGPLERSVYVWIASVLLIAVCAGWAPVPGVAWRVEGPFAWLLHAVQVAGVWLTLRSAGIIDIWDLAGVRQVAPPTACAAEDQEFKTSGPYGWVRHPIYVGWFLMVFASPLMTMTRLVMACTSGAYLLIAIPFEERSLLATTDGAYGRYMRRVKWKLVPRVY